MTRNSLVQSNMKLVCFNTYAGCVHL